ncbi:MAG TPA: FHA domain-containing protein [Ktedonobacteraceae bacterium]|nr:FHA domain-containing protein [Ktedonobacteraceae bacterium]
MSIQCSLGHDNPDGSAFCDECGEPLAASAPVATSAPAPAASAPVASAPAPAGSQICPSCGSTNAAGEAFCSNCGSMLGAPAPAANGGGVAVPAAPAANLTARLVVEADNQEFDLSGKDNIVIGREDAVSNIYPDVDLTPHGGEDGGVSRLHARIFYDNGQYLLEDENSTNFTFLNRQKLAGKTPTPLHDNDEIRLGRVLLRFKEA